MVCCYPRHNSPWIFCVAGCYSQHSLRVNRCYRQHIWRKNRQTLACWLSIHRCIFALELLFTAQFRVLLNTAQFGIFLLLFTAHFVFGLLFSAQFQNCCYLRHISEKSSVVIHDTVSAWVVILGTVVVGCKRGHNLWWLCAEFQRLLFTAQFGFFFAGCYAAHNFPLCCYLWHSLPRC